MTDINVGDETKRRRERQVARAHLAEIKAQWLATRDAIQSAGSLQDVRPILLSMMDLIRDVALVVKDDE